MEAYSMCGKQYRLSSKVLAIRLYQKAEISIGMKYLTDADNGLYRKIMLNELDKEIYG